MPEIKELIIIGAGFHSLSVIDLIVELNVRGLLNYKVLVYLDDNPQLLGKTYGSHPVLGPIEHAQRHPNAHFINGIYGINNLAQVESIIRRTGVPRERWPTIVHPTAWVSPHAQLGCGVFIYPMAYVYHSAVVNDFVLIKPRGTVGVAAVVGWGGVIGTNAILAGGVHVDRCVYVGQGSCIREKKRIGANSVVGMGSVVVRNVDEKTVVCGNPARPR